MPRKTIEYCCRELGIQPDSRQIEQAVDLRLAFIKERLQPRPGAIEMLRRLRAGGYKTALISNCSSEVPHLWPDSPFASLFAATVFSCEAGIRKPDPRVYGLASSRLDVPAERCFYIGDGDGGELAGAAAAGMRPVILRVPDEDPADDHLIGPEEWSGPRIERLLDVLSLV